MLIEASGLNPTEQQRARRCAKIFNGDNDMVILHAELDHVAGERVKTAMDALSTPKLKNSPSTNETNTAPHAEYAPATATYTTSYPGNTVAQPTSVTSPCYAPPATAKPTNTYHPPHKITAPRAAQ
ncbi:MAG: hypothetical protein OXE04_08415 [bacterium]|nr:hypothetical protein [bacterium]